MYTNSEFDRINNELLKRQSTRRIKLKKKWSLFLGITILAIVLLIAIFPKQFDNGDTAWILPTYGGMAFLAALIGFLVSLKYMSEKPFFEYLYDEVVNNINMNEGLFLEYKPYDKDKKEFNKVGGLFTRFAGIKVRRHVSGNTEDNHLFQVYDCIMTTSNGKSQQTHFDGTYYILKKELNTSLQVRTTGSPKLKGIKFIKQDDFMDLKVYKQHNHNMSNIDHQLYNFASILNANNKYKRVYLSVVEGEIHLALWYKKHPARKQKVFNIDVLNRVYDFYFDEYKLVNELDNIDAF